MMYVCISHNWEVKHVEVGRQLSAVASLSLSHTLGQNSGCHASTGSVLIHRTISLVPLISLSFLMFLKIWCNPDSQCFCDLKQLLFFPIILSMSYVLKDGFIQGDLAPFLTPGLSEKETFLNEASSRWRAGRQESWWDSETFRDSHLGSSVTQEYVNASYFIDPSTSCD